MTNQRYEINVHPESIIIGNDVILKCSIPSFVSDLVFVESWIDSEATVLGSEFLGTFLVTCMQHVGVKTVLKITFCFSIIVLNIISMFLVVHQKFETDVFKVNVILSNDIILKCVLPSHVADLVSVTSWVDSEGSTYTDEASYGNFSHHQFYFHFSNKGALN